MKLPAMPTKPYAPYKPQPPAKQIEVKTSVGKLTSQEDSEFGLQSFEELIKAQAPGVDPTTIRFTWEIDKEPTYYDETIITLTLKLYTVATVDNPNYSQLYKNYQVQLEKYHFDYNVYQKKLKQYKIDDKKYKEEVELWQVEHAKLILSRHDKKKIPASKKAIGSKK